MNRKPLLMVALCLLTAVRFAPLSVSPQQVNITAVESVGMTVSDLDRSVKFYSEVLSFQKVSEIEIQGSEYDELQGIPELRVRVARMRLGGEAIELTEYLTPKGRPFPADSRSNDHWFQHIAIIVSDMEPAYQRLQEYGIEHVSPGPQRLPDWNKNAGGIEAFYFKDPDGHVLEILMFPPDKGDRKWHRPTDKLFLGLDHTAIVVGDTETSLGFYRDVLGLAVVGKSENYGPEQERLNNVSGARLRITALRAPDGPGIEFLEYVSPRTGRPMPVDEKANDIFHWQTRMVTTVLEWDSTNHLGSRFPLVSPSVVVLPNKELGFGSGILVRDPDGHVLQIVEK